MKIISSYVKNKMEIEDRIRKGNVLVLDVEPNRKYWCYFCVKSIEDPRMRVLIDESKNIKTKYFSHTHCFKERLPDKSTEIITEICPN